MQQVGAVNICTLAPDRQAAYIKLLASVDGLVGLSATVVRTAVPMLVEVGASRPEAGGGNIVTMLATVLQWVAYQCSAGDLWLQQHAARTDGDATRDPSGVQAAEPTPDEAMADVPPQAHPLANGLAAHADDAVHMDMEEAPAGA